MSYLLGQFLVSKMVSTNQIVSKTILYFSVSLYNTIKWLNLGKSQNMFKQEGRGLVGYQQVSLKSTESVPGVASWVNIPA